MTQIRSDRLLGIGLVLLSSLAFSAQNIVSRLFFAPSSLLEQVTLGGFVAPALSNILFLLALRMGMMAVILAGLSSWLYPKTFATLRILPTQPKLFISVLASGVFLFLSLTFLYAALSQMAAGIVIATVFIHPALTLLLAWRLFHQPPRRYQIWCMVVISMGVVFTTLTPSSDVASNSALGILCALGSALSLGLYGIFTERSLKGQISHYKMHPVPFSSRGDKEGG